MPKTKKAAKNKKLSRWARFPREGKVMAFVVAFALVGSITFGVSKAMNLTCDEINFALSTKGSRPVCVKRIQIILNDICRLGKTSPNCSILAYTGNYDVATETQVKILQKSSHISANGRIGPTTWARICSIENGFWVTTRNEAYYERARSVGCYLSNNH